ncbi:MAG: hypothetical protein A2X94_09540 [Bdellovibrionales bacterium GWB1_55_8]|nr:MAG: hypothetical protein A2X94_09540 [Bdellovibrionales bacterium GWB1_55_8]
MSSFKIRGPEDLRNLSLTELEHLAQDLRQTILSVSLRNGGHLGASLGAVELAIALHRMFDSPSEPVLWDVGHQAYAHKLLTGRWEQFDSMRLRGGVSGFPTRAESQHDVFGTGHSSTAVSAALAMAWARRGTQQWTVAVVGDGGLSAGLSFEALNNIKSLDLGPLLIVLNDNHMSISRSVGALPSILSGSAPDYFQAFGLDFHGPVDGNHIPSLINVFSSIKTSTPERPLILHALTEKGRGYAPAEEFPGVYHGVSPVKKMSTEKITGSHFLRKRPAVSFSEELGKCLCEAAARDPKVVAISAAMLEGTGLSEFARRFPERTFDVGIAEPHAVTFAAGLATQGYRPVVAIYSTFLQRALDSIVHDVVLQKLPVVFAIDRAGLVGPDGPTHHGVFDLSYLGMLPGIRIYAPACISDLRALLSRALNDSGPVAIRFPRGGAETEFAPLAENSGMRTLRAVADPDLIVVALGTTTANAWTAIEASDPGGEKVSIVSVVCAKPIPEELHEFLRAYPAISVAVVEAGVVSGGFGQQLAVHHADRNFEFIGIPDRFIAHGSLLELEEDVGLSARALEERFRALLAIRGGVG